MKHAVWLAAVIAFGASPLQASSFYTLRPDDPKAVYLSHDTSSLHGDGVADDADAIQKGSDRPMSEIGEHKID